jgi:hypothetical protein
MSFEQLESQVSFLTFSISFFGTAAFILFFFTIILFFALHIPSSLSYLTGRYKRREIQKIRQNAIDEVTPSQVVYRKLNELAKAKTGNLTSPLLESSPPPLPPEMPPKGSTTRL